MELKRLFKAIGIVIAFLAVVMSIVALHLWIAAKFGAMAALVLAVLLWGIGLVCIVYSALEA